MADEKVMGMPQASVAGLSELETSKVLRNTYMLLAMTLGFSTYGMRTLSTEEALRHIDRIGFDAVAGQDGTAFLQKQYAVFPAIVYLVVANLERRAGGDQEAAEAAAGDLVGFDLAATLVMQVDAGLA